MNHTKNLPDFGKKTSRIWKKTQGYEALLGLLGLQKVHKKQAWSKPLNIGENFPENKSVGKSFHYERPIYTEH